MRMSLVLTEKSALACTNEGTVQLTATQSKLSVAGAKVLVTGDLASAPITGCQIVPAPESGASIRPGSRTDPAGFRATPWHRPAMTV